MIGIFDLLKTLLEPINRFFLSVLGLVGIAVGAAADPSGALNALIVRLIDFVAQYWPSTPEELKIANLIFSTTSQSVGHAVMVDIFQTAFLLLGVVLTVKVYKLIPLKFT